MTRRRAAAALTLMALLAAAIAMAAAQPSAGPPPRPRGPIPDSVLARVGTTREVTISGFRHGWAQVKPPARPDSLTPKHAREFLDLLIDKEALAERAVRQPWTWTAQESSQYVGYQDQLMLKVVLDSSFADVRRARRAAGDTLELDAMALGVAARESTIAHLDVRFDTLLTERLTAAWRALPRPSSDSSMWSQIRVLGSMPVVSPADTGRVVATSRVGQLRVSELLGAWRRVDPLARPRVETRAQLEDLAKNGIYERALRLDAARLHIDQRPDILGALARRREYMAVTHLVAREVYARLEPDSLTLVAWYNDHVDSYRLPDRALVQRIVLPDRPSAGRMAAQLRDPVQADTLIARGARSGADFREEITAGSDSALYATARRLGPGTVLGPDSTVGGWRVARVLELRDGRRRTFEEARTLAEHDWYGATGEALMLELVASARKDVKITINQRGLKQLVTGLP